MSLKRSICCFSYMAPQHTHKYIQIHKHTHTYVYKAYTSTDTHKCIHTNIHIQKKKLSQRQRHADGDTHRIHTHKRTLSHTHTHTFTNLHAQTPKCQLGLWLYHFLMGNTSPPQKMGVLRVTENCIWWWGCISGDLGSVKYLFTAITFKFTLIRKGYIL